VIVAALVNGNDTVDVIDAVDEARELTEEEAYERRNELLERVVQG
jgi:hypothetical protein